MRPFLLLLFLLDTPEEVVSRGVKRWSGVLILAFDFASFRPHSALVLPPSRAPEVALNFKEQGNEYFVGKRPREALGFYTQGIEASPTDKALLEVLYVNRAACNLALGTFPFPLSPSPL